jgi:hypothetical protein
MDIAHAKKASEKTYLIFPRWAINPQFLKFSKLPTSLTKNTNPPSKHVKNIKICLGSISMPYISTLKSSVEIMFEDKSRIMSLVKK